MKNMQKLFSKGQAWRLLVVVVGLSYTVAVMGETAKSGVDRLISAMYGLGQAQDIDLASKLKLVNGSVNLPCGAIGTDGFASLNPNSLGADPYPGKVKTLTVVIETTHGDIVQKAFKEGAKVAEAVWDGSTPDQVLATATNADIGAMHGKLLPAHDKWQLYKAGMGTLSFTAQTSEDAYVCFGTKPGSIDYQMVFGGWGNSRSIIRAGANGPEIYKGEGIALATSGTTNIAINFDTVNDTITITGLVDKATGAPKAITFKDPSFKDVQYFSFSSWDKPVVYSKIKVSIDNNPPKGFEIEASSNGEGLSCGSHNGELEVWAVAGDKMALERYDAHSLDDDPWDRVEAKDDKGMLITPLDSVSIASDGTMVILDEQGKAHRYDWNEKHFTALAAGAGNESLDLDIIAVGNAANIWAVDTEPKALYQHTKDGWVAHGKDEAIDVAVGVDGTVVVLNASGKPRMMLAADKWDKMGTEAFAQIAVGNKENIWGITHTGEVMTWTHDAWTAVLDANGNQVMGFADVTVNASGSVFLTDADGDLCMLDHGGFIVTRKAESAHEALSASGKKVAVAGKKFAVKKAAHKILTLEQRKARAAKKAGKKQLAKKEQGEKKAVAPKRGHKAKAHAKKAAHAAQKGVKKAAHAAPVAEKGATGHKKPAGKRVAHKGAKKAAGHKKAAKAVVESQQVKEEEPAEAPQEEANA